MFTYDPTLPLERDWLRLNTGDTDPGDVLLENEELDAIAASLAGATREAVTLAALRVIVSRLAALVDTGAGGVLDHLHQKWQHYVALRADYEALVSAQQAVIAATTGTIRSGVSLMAMPEGKEPAFRRGGSLA